MPARFRGRASHASCFSLLEVGAATSRDSLFAHALGQPRTAHRLRPDLVAADDPRGAVARKRAEVQGGGGEPDQRLDPADTRELITPARGHVRAMIFARG